MRGFAGGAAAAAGVATATVAVVGLVAGGVRVLPWLLDPAVPWRVAGPFARGLAAVAAEVALLVGWPVGWALACFRLVERGEERVLQTLGERPLVTMARLGPQGAGLALALAAVSGVYGRDAGAPGRVATELLAESRAACAAVSTPTTYVIPFTNLTWLCAADRAPRLVGVPGGTLGSALVSLSATGARIAGDLRSIELDDARLLVEGRPAIALHVASLSVRGMAPWAQASTLPATWRAVVLSTSAWLAASLAAYGTLLGAARTRVGAVAIALAGPLAALALMRLLERGGARPTAFLLVPLVGCACTAALAALLKRLPRLSARVRRALQRGSAAATN